MTRGAHTRARLASAVAAPALALAFAAVLAGCTTPAVCPAIWWGSTVKVELVGPTDAVDLVRLCVDDACTATPGTTMDELPVVVESFDPSDYATSFPTPVPGPVTISGYAERVDHNTWSLSMVMHASGEVTVQALSADGAVLAETETETELEFIRVGGTAECGGPTRAEVELVIKT